MQHVTVLCVGKLKESYWRDAVAEYAKRLSAFCRFTVFEVDEERLPDAPSAAQIAHTLEEEGKRLLARIPRDALTVALCIEGKTVSSEMLSARLSSWALDGKSHIVFVIGGSFGLSDEVKNTAALRLSMSPMTFPHQLARVMLLEQIYRAFQIASGGKYHK